MFSSLTGVDLIIFLVSLIVSLSIHEAMHAYVAHWLGDDTAHSMGRLTLNPLKHIDVFTTVALPMVLVLLGLPPIFIAKPVPFNPDRVKYEEFGAALVGVAGPLTNLVLAGVAGLVFHIMGAAAGGLLLNSILIFTAVNVGFFVFNMIPFPPLDGSRVLYAFAPEPLQDLMRQIESFGLAGILIFMLVIFQLISGPIVQIQTVLLNFFLG